MITTLLAYKIVIWQLSVMVYSLRLYTLIVVQRPFTAGKFVLAGSKHNMNRLAVQQLWENEVIQILQFFRLQGHTPARFAQQVICNDLRAFSIVTEFDIPTGLSSPLWAAVAGVRSFGKACAIAWLVVRAAWRVTDLGAISAACTVTIGAAKVFAIVQTFTRAQSAVWLALVLT